LSGAMAQSLMQRLGMSTGSDCHDLLWQG